jgi:hypothetical protein
MEPQLDATLESADKVICHQRGRFLIELKLSGKRTEKGRRKPCATLFCPFLRAKKYGFASDFILGINR